MKRKVCFLSKKEVFANRFFSWVLRNLLVIPVDREKPDIKTFKTVIERLKNGYGIGIFAQGKRVLDENDKAAKGGVALFATHANVPIVPVCISSSYKLFSKIHINIGEKIEVDEYKNQKIKSATLIKIVDSVMLKIDKLKIST